ncbi:HlyD family type I secretion periplasmic adaptor subunit [Alsobacter sp. SYSU M60028]|uniref:Membrane fusion protein (MFP) family protein n=1 Tax=Alsobacter ponti TaxID=2962936 RepID=A0ABT1LHE5_9HYPH|nr:HlyD family type I secretion periplasmic adaptor subunit [Alsobacter ponti]MCP8940115.1 HlyD family type I secretion periplasmic adaptor subunit [Alsobacter ponti]
MLMLEDKTGLPRVRRTARASVRRHLIAGIAVVVLLGGGVGVLGGTSEIAGAVIAPGQLAVDTSVKKVQHQTGGIVGEIRVKEGQHVEAGEVLVRLDETVLRANLQVVTKQLDELAARQARLEAERDDKREVKYPPMLTSRAGEPDIAGLMQSESRLFDLRATARQGQKEQLRQRVSQLQEEIQGIEGQISAKGREIELIQRELEGVRDLFKRNLVQLPRLTALERESTRLAGERGSLIASAAQAKGKISEIELQIIQIDQDLRSEVAKELREIQGKTAELGERRVAAEDQLSRVDIRAPLAGLVHQLSVHTVGGVVGPGEQMMLIVPEGEQLVIEVKVAPQDIDQLSIGQPASLRFSAFNQRTTPQLEGQVSLISADLSTDQRTGASYYTARIAVKPDEMNKLGSLKLLPGMPVEAFIQTGMRTMISYLSKPLTEQFYRSFRQQ